LEESKSEMGQFYSQDFVNYRGKTSDKERDYYTEIIAEWLLNNIKLFDEIKQLSNDITEANYYDYGKQGYDILVRIHDMGISKEGE